MSLWDDVKNKVQQWSGDLNTQISKYKTKDFAESAMAMCALVAAADGNIDAAEKRKMAGFIVSNDVLQCFNADELKQKFEHYCGKLEGDFDFGEIACLQAIGKLAKKPEQSKLIIQVGIIIGGADGNFDESEKKVIRKVCKHVGINPADFDL
jgi:tellurite resistance protein TerB